MNRISIFDYLDYPSYLREYYEYRKVRDPWFSYQYMADKLSLSNKSQIARIFDGKRKSLKPDLIEGFNKLLKHDDNEAEYFSHLVHLFQAPSAEEKNRILTQMTRSLRQQQTRELERREYQYLKEWYYPVVREVMTMPEFRGNAKKIAQMMFKAIPEEQIEDSISLLEDLGLVEKDGDHWILKDLSLSLRQDKRRLAVRHYQNQIMSMLPESLRRDGSYPNRTITVTFGINSERMKEVVDTINDFYKRFLGMLAEMDADKDQVYQFNLQLYPLTERYAGPDSEPKGDE